MSNKKDITQLVKDLEKEYGQGVLCNLDTDEKMKVEVSSTGSLILDKALGVGGYAKGRIVEVYGPESSGKTTLALLAIAEIQKNGGRAAFIDVEHALDPSYARKLGVDTKSLIVSQPDSGEQAMDITDSLVNSGMIDIVVVDSVAALVPTVELEGSAYEQTIGAQARLLSKALRKLTASIHKTNTIVIFINQIREKVGVIFGNPETTPGGRALKFYATTRLEIRTIERIKEGENIIGQRAKVKVVKNKLAAPYKVAEIDFFYTKGIDANLELFDVAVSLNIIEKAGAWYSYKNEKLGQGREQAVNKMISDKKMYDEIKKKVVNT